MNTTNRSDDPRSLKLDQMMQSAIQGEPRQFFLRNDQIIDFIMENPDLPISYDQFVFLLRRSSPAVSPMRKDYFDVLARLVSEAKSLGDAQLVKTIYLSMPFYPSDKENQQKRAFYQDGIEYFLSCGLYESVG